MHDVGVVTEDRQRVGGDGPGGDVHRARRQLAGDLEHVRHHQQQTLGRRERRGEGALLHGPVQRPGGAGFRLHLDDLGNGAPQVRSSGGGPLIRQLGHRRRRGDRVDRDHLAEGVRDAGGRFVAVHARGPVHAEANRIGCDRHALRLARQVRTGKGRRSRVGGTRPRAGAAARYRQPDGQAPEGAGGRDRGRRAHRADLQPRPGVLPGHRGDEARPRRLLPGRRPGHRQRAAGAAVHAAPLPDRA